MPTDTKTAPQDLLARLPYHVLSMEMTQQFSFFVPGDFDLTAKFHRRTFNCSEVIMWTYKLTNKQTPLKTSTLLRCATPVGKNNRFPVSFCFTICFTFYVSLVILTVLVLTRKQRRTRSLHSCLVPLDVRQWMITSYFCLLTY